MPGQEAFGVTSRRTGALLSVAAASVFAFGPPATTTPSAAWRLRAVHLCLHARLFDRRHTIGTLAGALAVAHDIRLSTRRRLARLRPPRAVPPVKRRLIERWLSIEQRLAGVYARSYVRIFDVIAASRTSRQRAREVAILLRLLHLPGRLREIAQGVEARLDVPDCTGGG